MPHSTTVNAVTVTSPPDPHNLLTAAADWHSAGYAVMPTHPDNSKRPMGSWSEYQVRRPDEASLHQWLTTGNYTGIGVITGAVSGNLELVEIEGPADAARERLDTIAEKVSAYPEDMRETWQMLLDGCTEESAGGGLHIFYRVTDGPVLGNTKLAHANGKVVAETRGEGGFCVVAPTPGRKGHPEGSAYRLLGSPHKTPTITAEQRDLMHLLVQDALQTDPTPAPRQVTHSAEFASPSSALDEYRESVTWREILEPAGWTHSHFDGQRDHWTRPGKHVRDGTSATTIEDGPLYCFSTSVQWPTQQGLSKGQVYAHLHHGGDLSAAASDLRAQGYGSPGPLAEFTPDGDHQPPADPFTDAVQRKYAELRVLDEARALLATEKASSAPALDAVPLSRFLDQPDAPERFRIGSLWPLEGRVLLAAAAKSGKTTMVAANLLPSLVDGDLFLGRHCPEPVAGSVVLLNMEVGENTLRRWMRDAGIQRTEQVVLANLRGKASALTLATDKGRQRFADFLTDHQAEVVILDPLAPVLASLGLDENSNADVARFFSWWSEALHLAGVRDDLVVHHAGHAGQRSRGASRLLDEPDAVWTLTRDTSDSDQEFSALEATRYLSAYGRDVDMAPEALAFDAHTRRLSLTGKGKAAIKADRDSQAVLALFADGKPRSRNAIANESPHSRNKTWKAVERLVEQGLLEKVATGTNGYPLLLPSTVIEEG